MAGKSGAGKGAAKGGRGGRGTVIIRREEIIEGGHHGGAWKVAYADFVTAMMAFFLLMWLINATTEDQRRGIAAYFSPMAKVENGFSGTGMVPGGASPFSDGAQLLNQGPPQLAAVPAHADPSKTDNDGEPEIGAADQAQPGPTGIPVPASASALVGSGSPFATAAAEDKALNETARHLREAVAHDPGLAAVAGQMAIDVTPDGLRIQIMDAQGRPMFNSGSTVPTARAKAMLEVVARFIATLPEPVSIGGHTDGAPFRSGQLSNWTLSSGRADSARDVLVAAGLPDAHLSNVTGYADRKLLLPADPLSPANRRVVLTLQRTWPQPAGVAAPAAR